MINADLKICQYLCLHMKIMCWRFNIKAPFIFWDMRTWDTWNVCLRTFRNNRICWKLAYFFRNLQTSRAVNTRILRIRNMEFSGYCFYMNTIIQRDFQICISILFRRTVVEMITRQLISHKSLQLYFWTTKGLILYFRLPFS